MAGDRYDRGWRGRGYGREYGARPGPRGGRYDRGWTGEMAYGREPAPMQGPGMFSPFGWDPMMRWAGWDPLMGFVPYQDAPQQWSYGLEGDYQRYEHDYYRGNTTGGYGRDYPRAGGYGRDFGGPRRYGRDFGPTGGYGRDFGGPRGYDREQHAVPPRQSPTYGRGGDHALQQWARERGYDVQRIIRPRPGPRR
jgi:hypothetical protein